MKVFVDITFAALIFFFFGFALIYGKDADRLIGATSFRMEADLTHINFKIITHDTYWLFQCAFAGPYNGDCMGIHDDLDRSSS
ncbi:ammonium transporter [Paenibacillus elgii]|uniref:ammonium transporter n=1 Tax=Paenibacillus elgii TaxID=189691 RepID=UPI0009EDD7FD|nr:ammonium transporter [Paenibacillus elgii]